MDEITELTTQAEDLNVSDEHDAQKGKYMTFKSGNEYYGLKIQYVNEIISFQAITAIPETEDYIKGLINLRGKIIPVIDVVEIREENILPPPSIGRADKVQNKYVFGIGKVGDSVKLLLDPDKLLNDTDMSVLDQTGEIGNSEEVDDK